MVATLLRYQKRSPKTPKSSLGSLTIDPLRLQPFAHPSRLYDACTFVLLFVWAVIACSLQGRQPGEVHFGPKNAQVSPQSAQVGPQSAQVGPKSAQVGPESVHVDPKSVQVDSKLAPRAPKFAPRLPKFGSKRDQVRHKSAKLTPRGTQEASS